MIRLENKFASFIDWDHNGISGGTPTFPQDVNFNGLFALSVDSDDWNHLNLQQVGARLNVSGLSGDVHLGRDALVRLVECTGQLVERQLHRELYAGLGQVLDVALHGSSFNVWPVAGLVRLLDVRLLDVRLLDVRLAGCEVGWM